MQLIDMPVLFRNSKRRSHIFKTFLTVVKPLVEFAISSVPCFTLMAFSEFFNVTNERANSAKTLHIQSQPKKSVFLYLQCWSYKKNLVYNAKGFIGRGSNGFSHNGIFIPIAQIDVSFLLPCHFAYHITQKLLFPLFSVSMESNSAVRTTMIQQLLLTISRRKTFLFRDRHDWL
jgi:hypothetical protein